MKYENINPEKTCRYTSYRCWRYTELNIVFIERGVVNCKVVTSEMTFRNPHKYTMVMIRTKYDSSTYRYIPFNLRGVRPLSASIVCRLYLSRLCWISLLLPILPVFLKLASDPLILTKRFSSCATKSAPIPLIWVSFKPYYQFRGVRTARGRLFWNRGSPSTVIHREGDLEYGPRPSKLILSFN